MPLHSHFSTIRRSGLSTCMWPAHTDSSNSARLVSQALCFRAISARTSGASSVGTATIVIPSASPAASISARFSAGSPRRPASISAAGNHHPTRYGRADGNTTGTAGSAPEKVSYQKRPIHGRSFPAGCLNPHVGIVRRHRLGSIDALVGAGEIAKRGQHPAAAVEDAGGVVEARARVPRRGPPGEFIHHAAELRCAVPPSQPPGDDRGAGFRPGAERAGHDDVVVPPRLVDPATEGALDR